MKRDIKLNINGKDTTLNVEDRRSLLDVLREDLGLTGAKYGCGEGECGACTVLIGGKATRSCITTIAEAQGAKIETIEGLGSDVKLHPVQQAFIDEHAMQCGYCVPGQILAAVALLRKSPQPTRQQMIEALNGNLCRCCNYPNILAAVDHAANRPAKAPAGRSG